MDSFVTCKIYGQLGNQLFQIASTLAFSLDYGVKALFPALHQSHWNISYNRDYLFFRLDSSLLPRPPLHSFDEVSWFSPERIPFAKDLLINGYFQSFRHFHHHRDPILRLLTPSEGTRTFLEKTYGALLKTENLIGLHVRTQSKRTHDAGIHPFWSIPYYEMALKRFPKEYPVLVCSDRINWCKKHFSQLDRKFIYIEGNSGIEDLFLLAKCRHLILSNSSFSWWAAYLHEKEDGEVIFPEYWKEEPLHTNPNPKDFFLPSWTLLRPTHKPPYPSDIFFCDARSLSVDNQD